MADYTTLKATIASVIKTNGNQEITGLLLQQTLHSMLDGVNTTKQDTINFVINTANKFLRDDGTFQEIPTPTGSFTNNVYLSSLPSDIATYKILSYEPDSSEVITTNSISASEGNKLVATYLYPVGVDTNLIPAGLWSFIFNSYVSSTVGNTNIGVQCFARAINGSETTLFTVWSETIGSTSIKETKINYSGQTYNVNTSDRIGIRVLLRTTSVPSLNVSFIVGDGRGSYFNTPISIRHKQIRSLNEDPNYQHITQTEKTNFQTAFIDRFKWDGGSSGLNAVTGRESLGLRIGVDVLAYRTFGSAANNNTNDFLAYNGVAVDSSKLGGQLPSYYQTNITAGTSLQYYRGDKTMQTLDTSVVPENSNMYFTYPRVLATALTGYVAGANTALSATDTILAAMGKIQGQINARALASDLSGHINNTTIHLTADEKTYLGKIMTYLKVAVDNTSMYSTINFYSESGVSAYGIGTGGGGGAGVDIIDNLLSVRADAALSANQGRILKGFVDLKQPQLNGTGLVRMSGTGVTYDNNSYALASHNHNGTYALLAGSTSQAFSASFIGIGVAADNTWRATLKGQYPLQMIDSIGAIRVELYADSNQFKMMNGLSIVGYSDLGITQKYIISATTGAATFSSSVSASSFISGGNAVLHAGNYSSYALPLSGGILSGQVICASTGADTYGGAFEIRERGYVTTSQTDWSYSPAITFHWGGFASSRFGLRSDGQFAINNTNVLIHSGNIGSQSVNYAASAGNADTLDSYHASYFAKEADRYQYGTTDLKLVSPMFGFFASAPNPANSPNGVYDTWVQGIQFGAGGGNTDYRQLLICNGADFYVRMEGGGNWGDWRKLYDSGNDGSGSGLDADLLDGLQSENFVYGGNATKTISSSYSLTGYFPSGFYYNNSQFVIHSSYYGVGNVAGLSIYANDATNGDLYFRVQDGGGGGVQRTIWHTGNLTNTLSNGYLPYWNGSSLVNSPLLTNGDDLRYFPIANAYGNPVLVIKDDGSNGTLDIASEIIGEANLDSNPITFRVSNITQGRYEVLRISNSGRVDIGFAGTRSEKFAVNGDGYFNSKVLAQSEIALLDGGGLGSNGASSTKHPVSAYEAYGWNFTIQETVNGQFGIWNASRTAKYFSIVNGGNAAFSGDVNVGTPSAPKTFSVRNIMGYGATFLGINPWGGNVSIGWDSDQGYKLAVNGNGYINGNLYTAGYLGVGIAPDGVFRTIFKGSYPIQMRDSGGNVRVELYADSNQFKMMNGLSIIGYTDLGNTVTYNINGSTGNTQFGGFLDVYGRACIWGGHTPSSSNFTLELRTSYGSSIDEVSIRFHQENRWYHQIRNSGSGFRFTQGGGGDYVPIFASVGNFEASVKIGANWEAIPNGSNELELRYGGVMKAKLSSSGDILAVGGVTAFAV